MISRVTTRKSGLAQYLLDGKRADSNLLRNEKDNVIPLYGSLSNLKKAEEYCNKHKNWSANYEHITISFSDEDIAILDAMSEEDYQEALRDITLMMIKHRTSGYDIDNEVIAYGECHEPKVKEEVNARNGKVQKRRTHIHIGLSLLNPLSDTKLQTTFYNNSYISDTIDKYIAKKHGLTYAEAKAPSDNDVDNPSQMTINRNILKEATKDFTTKEQLYNYFDANGIEYDFTNKKSNTKQSNVYVYNDKGGKIHLRGKDFPNIEIMHNNTLNDKTKVSYIKELKTKSLQELGDILETYYKTNRIPLIDKRRSKETKQILNDIYKQSDNNIENNKVNSFTSLQAKIFYKHYKHLVTTNLKGYYVDTKQSDKVKFSNKAKEIEVVDHGNKITANTSTKNLEEKVKLMVDIAIAKEWNLSSLIIHGSDAFKKEAYRQIADIIRAEQEKNKTLPLQQTAVIKGVEQPKTVAQYLAREHKEKMQKQSNAEDLKILKKELSAEQVLAHAVEKYKLDISQYEVTEDNKINNLGNRAKPKNVIDFLQKEIKLTSKEAIEECQALYENQPMPVQVSEPTSKEPIKLKPKQRISDAERNIYKHINSENGEQRRTSDGVRKLSDINLLHNKKRNDRVLLPSDERDSVWTKSRTDKRVQSKRSGNHQTPIKSREIGGLKMPLHLSINKSEQKNALTGWEVVEVQGYSQLAILMKQHAYSSTRFDNKRDADNANTFNNLIIFDIDNDPNDKQLTMKEAKELLESKGVSAMILPSKSNQIEKFTSSGKSKGIKDRYRIVIPAKSAIKNDTDKDTYREFQRLIVKALGLEGAVDTSAMNDKARYYYPSPLSAIPLIVKADKVMDISNLENKAIKNVQAVRAEKEAQRLKMEQLRAKMKEYRVVSMPTYNNLTFTDAEELMNVPISRLIEKFEGGELKEEGSYHYIKTDSTKYSIIDDRLAHDFKNDVTYNSLTYLQMQYETNNLNMIARELEKVTGENYIKTNVEAVKTAVTEALESAVNDKAFEQEIKTYFGCEYCKLEGDTLKIADQSVKLAELDMNKGEVIEKFKENRAEVKIIEEVKEEVPVEEVQKEALEMANEENEPIENTNDGNSPGGM